ncbi:MAG TPA: hypothetical protein ENN88_03630 [Candidatus Coatesbacteria bacterium]|nr:hypothetical protein [Candidatus Coatesbacteria bacterium]
MIAELPVLKVPEWLKGAAEDGASPPLINLLTDSLYYPGCGFNGTPVKFLAGNIYSFIFADWGIEREKLLANLNGTGRGDGFKGYRSLFQRDIAKEELVPENWVPPLNPLYYKHKRRADLEQLKRMPDKYRPFAHWSIWERREGFAETHGPSLFSFFFIGGEMCAVYQELYCRLQIAPLVLALIQVGGFDNGWEDPRDNSSFFKAVVSSNPAGMPEYLIRGGYSRGGYSSSYAQPCWPEYRNEYIARIPERSAHIFRLEMEQK